MARTVYLCEGNGGHCSNTVPNSYTRLCSRCEDARQSLLSPCPLCGEPFDPGKAKHQHPVPVCCGTTVAIDFYRGHPLPDTAIGWMLDPANPRAATAEQRSIAVTLAETLVPGDESWPCQADAPWTTTWWTTPGADVEVTVEFAGANARHSRPVECIEIGIGGFGVSAKDTIAITRALTGATEEAGR